MLADPAKYKDLKLKLDGMVPPGHGFHRNVLLETLYASLPRDPQVKVQIYNAEIEPGGYTNWHCHNGAAFFVALQGLFEAHFQEGVLVKAKGISKWEVFVRSRAYLINGVCFLANCSSRQKDHARGRLLFRADRQIPPRAQSAPGATLSLRRHLLHRARPRARDQFGGAAVVSAPAPHYQARHGRRNRAARPARAFLRGAVACNVLSFGV